MALIDDYQIEKIWTKLLVYIFRVIITRQPLVKREINLVGLINLPILNDVHYVVTKRRKIAILGLGQQRISIR
jgi:hypothetical protein